MVWLVGLGFYKEYLRFFNGFLLVCVCVRYLKVGRKKLGNINENNIIFSKIDGLMWKSLYYLLICYYIE